MQRNPTFRRLVVATVMFLALFTQYQTLFACEKMDAQAKPMCCCDEPGDMSKGCAQGAGCLDEAGPVSSFTDCCEISFAPVTEAANNTPGMTSQQIALLDGPQPPPILTVISVSDFSNSVTTIHFISTPVSFSHKTDTYQQTNRYRI